MNRSFVQRTLFGFFRLSRVALVTPLRDGMNLVAYEYISSQVKKHGVMILSEFAGAAQSLNGSLIINPCEWWSCTTRRGGCFADTHIQ